MKSYFEVVPMNLQIGERMRAMRVRSQLSQQAVASVLKVDRSTYCKYEIGGLTLKFDAVIALCDLFGCTLDYLLGRVTDPHSYFVCDS